MIFERIVLHNVGVYRGKHVIDLSPPSRQKPIILFGGLNGGGKTTLLDALQLALYGRMAQCSNRGDLAYDEFLRRSIHRSVDAHDGASITVEMTHTADGATRRYQVRRSWSVKEKHVRDRLEIVVDGAYDSVLTDGWAEAIEEMIPVRLSKFFFFDGEKIESLADPDRASEALATGVQVLLGLDLVDQLVTDLTVLERRKKTEQKSAPDREIIEAARLETEKLAKQRDALVLDRGAAQVAVDRAERALREAEERFKLGGGEAFERRKHIESERASLSTQIERLDEELREEAEGIAPLLLVTDLLDAVQTEAETEQSARDAQALGALLAERDRHTLAAAKAAGATRKVLDALHELFAADRTRHASTGQTAGYLHLTAEARASLAGVRASLHGDAPSRIARKIQICEHLLAELDAIDRKLASVPAEETIADLAEQRTRARDDLSAAQRKLREIEQDLDRVSREHDHRWDKYTRLMKKNVEEQAEQQALGRIVTHAERVRQTMDRFRGAMLDRRVRRIEQLVLEGFQHLLRKEGLIAGLRIDPRTFAMTLLAPDGRALSPERLSAGERQLLAVSTIWALARASGRPLPVVIDTPLGRLDSVHRKHLLERYFPHASHQVILLSTDKEIDEAHYDKLKSAIGRVYTLRFDDKTASTTVEPGYFW
ncbi:MAG: DNA sulfur modification protein DndD [Byssovorax sp.]